MVGRARELGLFQAAFDRTLAGRRQLVLISGEPGIGKTRCAEALADLAEDQGALVLWGRCREDAGAPPYWPWVQILRGYVAASSLDEVRLNMGTAAKDLAALVPELFDSSHQEVPLTSARMDSTAARFRTFDAVRCFFQQATQQVPITLVLDDLHWADAPSLLLFEFLAQESLRTRLLITCTYRDGEVSRRTQLLATLGELSRDSDAQRVELSGLSQIAIGEVAHRLCNIRLSELAVNMIYRRTDGNPLFAIELIKVLIEESAGAAIGIAPVKIPAGVRETIGRRLARLSDSCNELLCTAAVHGNHFTAREIAVATQQDVATILTVLQPAVQAGIVQSNADAPGHFQFTHGLIREAIYEELPAVERLRAHGRAADALVAVHCSHPDTALTRIAHHYHQANALGYSEQAVMYGLRAAESAARLYAYEDAVLHYDRVIEILENGGLLHDERLARAYVLKGSALRLLGQADRAIDVLFEAVNRTRVLGSSELLVDVLVSLAMASQHVAQRHLVPLLNSALTILPEDDGPARAKALATLAFAQRSSADGSRPHQLVDQALGMAGRCCDAASRCACYQLTIMALRGDPHSLSHRLLLGEECIAAARTTGSSDLLADAFYWQVLNLFEAGQIEALENILEHYERLSTARVGVHQYWTRTNRVTLALLRGEWADLESQIEALQEIGTKTRRGDADGVYGAQMFALHRELGRLHGLAPQIKQIATSATFRMWEPGLMLVCAEIGFLDEARELFDRLVKGHCYAIYRDDMYVACLVFCAQTCWFLKDGKQAESLYRLLHAYEGQTANHPTAVCFGATDLYLGMLAALAGDNLARAHFDHALTLNRAMRAWPALARTLFHYGEFLLRCSTDVERHQGFQQLREAEQLARRFAMTRLVIDVDALLRSKDGAKTFPDDLTAREVEVLRLLAIGRSNKDISLVLAISLNTVATHVRSILNKTQCANRTEAATYAMRHGLHGTQSFSTAVTI